MITPNQYDQMPDEENTDDANAITFIDNAIELAGAREVRVVPQRIGEPLRHASMLTEVDENTDLLVMPDGTVKLLELNQAIAWFRELYMASVRATGPLGVALRDGETTLEAIIRTLETQNRTGIRANFIKVVDDLDPNNTRRHFDAEDTVGQKIAERQKPRRIISAHLGEVVARHELKPVTQNGDN